MKPAPFTYHAPRSLREALRLMGTLDNARVLAGGQSLIPMLNYRVLQPDHIIDLGRIPELAGMDDTPRGLRIGAMTTQRTIEQCPEVRKRYPLLIDALNHVGHQQTRNRGTIGGSLCHLDPAAELPVMACALDPIMCIASHDGRREIPFSDFPVGHLTSLLEPDEILVAIIFKPLPEHTGTAFEEFAYRPADFAVVSVAAAITMDSSGQIAEARTRHRRYCSRAATPHRDRSNAVRRSRSSQPNQYSGRHGRCIAVRGRSQQPRGVSTRTCRSSDETRCVQGNPAECTRP